MLWRIALLLLALVLLTSCSGTRTPRATTSSYDPCRQMRVEGEQVGILQDQVRDLQAAAYPDPDTLKDTAAPARAESLLVFKENLLDLTMQGMERSSMDCAARQRPFDRYRTPDEIEDRRE
jgi:hypothetical protein